MDLELDRQDLKPKHRETLNCSQTQFEHFSVKVQRAIRATGKAMFRDHGNYNRIYPPKSR